MKPAKVNISVLVDHMFFSKMMEGMIGIGMSRMYLKNFSNMMYGWTFICYFDTPLLFFLFGAHL